MKPPLSIIMTVLNDNEEANSTVKSIRDTAGDDIEVIAIDDCSSIPLVLNDKFAILRRNEVRLGVGGSRHLAASLASSDYLLITDSHMRFEPGWADKTIPVITGKPKTLHCGCCLGLDADRMDLAKHAGEYNGATLCLYQPKSGEILEGKWITDKAGEDNYDLACIMGASYYIPKDFYFHLRGLDGLKMWGTDEPYLSLKTWLAGGEVKMLKSSRIGHKFRNSAPYSTGCHYMIYNKLRVIYSVLGEPYYSFLSEKFPKDANYVAARHLMDQEKQIIDDHKNYYKTIFVNTPEWYFNKFNIAVPDFSGATPVS